MAARIGKSSVSTPFDQAWSLLKMPLVPGSFTRQGGYMRGKFYDPVSSQEMPISVGSDKDAPNPGVLIFPPEGERGVRGDLRTSDAFSREIGPYHMAYESYVEPEFRRRGYGKAMYDAMAYYLANMKAPNSPLLPHPIQSSLAEKLWMEHGNPEGFPVREDLE